MSLSPSPPETLPFDGYYRPHNRTHKLNHANLPLINTSEPRISPFIINALANGESHREMCKRKKEEMEDAYRDIDFQDLLTPTTQKPPEALLLLLQNTEALFLSLATAAMQMIEEENNALRHLRRLQTIIFGDDTLWDKITINRDSPEVRQCREVLQDFINLRAANAGAILQIRQSLMHLSSRRAWLVKHLKKVSRQLKESAAAAATGKQKKK